MTNTVSRCIIKAMVLARKKPAMRFFIRKKEMLMSKNHSYFSHRDCEYFPCHKDADPNNFNCLFCYCPLYALGDRCGGDFVYLPTGAKDCSRCIYPHLRENYHAIIGRYKDILAVMKRNDENDEKK